jgi:putative oxidoreductase
MAQGNSSTKLYVPAVQGLYDSLSPWGYPIMRIATGLFLMPHGAQKLFGLFGGSAQGMAAFFAKVGIEPALPLVYAVGCIEFFGGLCIALGFLTRPAAVAVVIMMAVAIIKVHLGNGYFWTQGGFEYPLLWGILAFTIFCRGGGPRSIDAKIGKEF